MNKLYLHANNVHQGGGRSLLLALLKAISGKYDCFATLDARLHPLEDLFVVGSVKWVGHSVLQRLNSEWWLTRQVKKNDVLLCFGNLPPLFRSRGRVIVFVQNRYLVDPVSLHGFSVADRFRIQLERLWLIQFSKNVDLFIVQTPTMKSFLQMRISRDKPVDTLPFALSKDDSVRSVPNLAASVLKFDFLYVASGEPHKNHGNLVEAWCLLAQAGMFPSLCLTVDEVAFPEICRCLQTKKTNFGLRIENLGSIPYAQIQRLYGQVRALIFTSSFESLGLPLIEARQAGLAVLAPELDYVRDVLDPEQVFDPASPISIARAVKRFLGLEKSPLVLLDAAGFLNHILQ